MNNYYILSPVYTDWKPLKKLLLKIDTNLKSLSGKVEFIAINDGSTTKPNLKIKYLNNIDKIKIINLKKNLGSQKAISVGLNYLKNRKNSIISIIDSDGEDDPNQMLKMFKAAKKNSKYVVVSNRTKRKEIIIFKILYKIHLLVTFILTWKWISFGNYTSFHSKNLKKIIKSDDTWFAYAATISKRMQIKNLFAEREKRYFGMSKVSFLKLFFHSFKILVVLKEKIMINTSIYLAFLYLILNDFDNIFFSIFIIFFLFNIIIFLYKILSASYEYKINQKLIKNTKLIYRKG